MQSLTLDSVRHLAPAAFTAEKASGLSDRYIPVRTMDVVEPVLSEGWEIVEAHEAGCRSGYEHSRFYKMHMLRISHPKLEVPSDDPYRIDVVIFNSNAGDKSFSVDLGVLRGICMNGAVFGDLFGGMKIRHLYPADRVKTACEEIMGRAPEIAQYIEDWKHFELNPEQALALAKVAANLRWGKIPVMHPSRLLESHRSEDDGPYLWRVFNRTQENVLRGSNIHYVNAKGNERKLREIKSLVASVRINRGLWRAAETLYKGEDLVLPS